MRYMMLLLLPWLPLTGQAEVYKTVDENGNVVYTDNPRAVKGEEPKPVDLPAINTQPPPTFTAKPSPKADTEASATDVPTRYRVSITSPAEGTFVPPGQRDVTVTAALEPQLSPEHRLEVLLNGKVMAREATTSITLKEVFRGSHKVQVRVVDKRGRAIGTSAPVTIYVRRVSVAKPSGKSGN